MESTSVIDLAPGCQSPLLRLPAELRVEIYKHVLNGKPPTVPYRVVKKSFSTFDLTRLGKHPAALIQLNRQIRGEAESLFYNRTHFSFSSTKFLLRWLRELSHEQIDLIEHIELRATLPAGFLWWVAPVPRPEMKVLVRRIRGSLRDSGVWMPQELTIVLPETGEKLLWVRGRKEVIRLDTASLKEVQVE